MLYACKRYFTMQPLKINKSQLIGPYHTHISTVLMCSFPQKFMQGLCNLCSVPHEVTEPDPRTKPIGTDTNGPAAKLDAVVTAAMNMMDKKIEQTISKLENTFTSYADMVKGTSTTTDAVRTTSQVQLPIPSNAENVTQSDNLKEL